MKRARCSVLAGVLVGAVSLLSGPQIAHAAPAEEGSQLVDVVEAPMYVADIDTEQAEAAGNRVVLENGAKVLIDGRTGEELARIPVGGARQESLPGGEAAAAGVVYGNCGSSYFYLYDSPGSLYYYTTGFNVKLPAVDFDFYGTIRGEWARGSDNLEWSRGNPLNPPRPYWGSGRLYDSHDAPSGTYYFGRVSFGQAILNSGEVCYSGSPSAGANLYR